MKYEEGTLTIHEVINYLLVITNQQLNVNYICTLNNCLVVRCDNDKVYYVKKINGVLSVDEYDIDEVI